MSHDWGVSEQADGGTGIEAAAPPPDSPGRKRASQTVADMVRSLGLVLVVVVVIVLITLRHNPPAVNVIDPRPVLLTVAADAPYTVVQPHAPSTWRATAAHASPMGSQPYSWLVGYLTPTGTYAEVAQQDGQIAQLVSNENANGDPAGSITINGVDWQMVSNSSTGRNALIGTVHGTNTVVSGTASFADLGTLTRSLIVVPSPTRSAAG
jgi:Protein of unknown function (DUF4245)